MLPPPSDLQASLFPDSSAQIREPVNVIKIGSALGSDGKCSDENKSFYQDTIKHSRAWGGGDNVSFPSFNPSGCRLPTIRKHLPRSVSFALLKRKGERVLPHSRFLPTFSSGSFPSARRACCEARRAPAIRHTYAANARPDGWSARRKLQDAYLMWLDKRRGFPVISDMSKCSTMNVTRMENESLGNH